MRESLLPTLLLVLFIGLKLAGIIDWSWWWVMSPFWIPAVIAAVAFAVLLYARSRETPQQRAARRLQEYADALEKRRG